jgi:hypothetical protein
MTEKIMFSSKHVEKLLLEANKGRELKKEEIDALDDYIKWKMEAISLSERRLRQAKLELMTAKDLMEMIK